VYSLLFLPQTDGLHLDELGAYFLPQRALFAAGLLLVIYVPLRVREKKWPHVAQLLLLPPAAMFWFIGSMALAHDWI
jgi:hypothetical protein